MRSPLPRLLLSLGLLSLLAVPAAPGAVLPRARAEEPPALGLSEPARWLRDYVRIDTTNPPGNEHRAAAHLAAILHREEVPTRLLVSPGGRTSLYARLEANAKPGTGPGASRPGALVLLHHTDVVSAGTGWSVDPFAGEIRDGVLYGRGALDIKSLGVAHLAAFVDLARGLREGRVTLTRDVVYLAVADEERGGEEGVAWILERHGDLLGEIGAVLGEGGANRTVNGRHLWAGVEVAQKRPLWLRISATGRAGHGSGLNPGSAPHRLIRGLARALELPPRWKVTEASRLYLGAIAPLHNPTLRRIFEDPDRYIREDGPTTDLLPGLANLFLDTFQVTVLEGSDKINVVPAVASARVDVRLLPETDAEEYLARLRDALGSDLGVEVLLTSPPSEPAPVDLPIYRAVAEVLGETAPAVPAFIPGFTDSRYFRERGIAAYGVSPFFLEPQRFLGIHGPDESIPLAEVDRGVERMRRIVRACATR